MLEVRTATSADCGRLAQLCADLGYPTSEPQVRERLRLLQERPGHHTLVAVDHGVVVGFVSCQRYETLFDDAGLNITGLVVDAGSRGRGVGTALIGAAEAVARREGLAFVRANSGAQRTEAHQFYRGRGFDSEKDQKRFIRNLG